MWTDECASQIGLWLTDHIGKVSSSCVCTWVHAHAFVCAYVESTQRWKRPLSTRGDGDPTEGRKNQHERIFHVTHELRILCIISRSCFLFCIVGTQVAIKLATKDVVPLQRDSYSSYFSLVRSKWKYLHLQGRGSF